LLAVGVFVRRDEGSERSKTMKKIMLATLALLGAVAAASAQNPSPDDLNRRMIERRAVEAVIWGMPAVNFELMFQAMERETKGTWNQIVYWSRPSDWKNQTLTPNPDTIYLMPFFSTRDGPVVMEIPPAEGGSITGTIMDSWQMPLEDVGPAGVDKGKGGKYLITPPGYTATAPDGYIVLPSQTNYGYALLRANLKSDSAADVAAATAYGRRIKLYPLAQAANPPVTVFVDAIDVVYDATIPYDARYFAALDRFVQREPWLTRDKAMIDQLKSVGIEKGKPFRPDAARERILNTAAAEAGALLQGFYLSAFANAEAFYPGGKWGLPHTPDFQKESPAGYTAPEVYPVDERGLAFTFVFFTPKHLGGGQFYLMTLTDKAGQKLSGASTYRLRVPPNAPIKLYWSATLYDRASHALIRNAARPSRSSLNPDQRKNADGSVDLYFGPTAPQGMEANWIPTDPKGEFEVLFRLYGPEPSFFEKKWVLPDIEKVAAQ
jgi:hypothetical protein